MHTKPLSRNPEAVRRPPVPAEISHLKASNAAGLSVLGSAVLIFGVGLALSMSQSRWLWLAGQSVLALSFVQWFALLHECGHETLFRVKALNTLVGRLAGFMSLIPFQVWKRVHGRHHKWTGWQDVDPTTQALVPRPLGKAERLLMNVCWKFWIPIFSILYRINNFWNVPRLRVLFPRAEDRRRLGISLIALTAAYVVVIATIGVTSMLNLFGLALILSLMAEDVLLLSQHTHIPQQISHGERVRPFPTIEQEVFTRSLVFPRWLTALTLHIDAHELHHMYPFVPGYRLGGIAYDTENVIGWWTWIRRARALPGEVFLFQNRLETGADI